MGLQSYRVSYSTASIGPWTALTNVQAINIKIGREAQLDQASASTGSVVVRYPTGYASPIAALVSGTFILVENNTGTAYDVWRGQIANVSVEYGIPYAGGVGNADFLNIGLEGHFATLGRLQGSDYAMPANTGSYQCYLAQLATNTFIGYTNGDEQSVLAATTISSTWADWYSKLALTVNGRVIDGSYGNEVWIKGPYGYYSGYYPDATNISTVNFSDTTNNATNQVYDTINFDSLSDNFYTQVIVSREAGGSSTATKAGAVNPYRTYQVNTLNSTAGQSTDYANYLLGIYGTAKFAISSVSCIAEAQNSFKLDRIGGDPNPGFSVQWPFAPGTQINVTFRGTTYPCIIEGCNMTSTPAGTRFTYYFSGAELNNVLILDNTVFGTLDNNRLGY
jgi:hypothetical protein